MIEDPEGVLADYHRWLYKVAADLLPGGHGDRDLDDLVNEGRIAMWRAMETFDESMGALAPWITTAARNRMRDLAWGKGQSTGRPETRGSREVDLGPSLDADPERAIELFSAAIDSYFEGDLPEFFDALTPTWREYIFLRFWAGLDPTSRSPEMRALVKQFPVLGRKHVWQRASQAIKESRAS